MDFQVAFSPVEIGILIASLVLLIAVGIHVFKFVMARSGQKNLKEVHIGMTAKSPIDGRSKYPEVDINRHRNIIWNMSLAIVLSAVVLMFGWTSYEDVQEDFDFAIDMEEIVEIEPPRTAEPPPPPPPPPKVQVIQELPEELIEEEDDVDFLDQSIDEETVIAPPPPKPLKKAEPGPPPPPPPIEDELNVAEIFKIVESMPRFPGCEDMDFPEDEKRACSEKKLYEFLMKNMRYPLIARENGIEGMVYIQFVIEPDGSVSNANVVRDVGAGCGEEALRIVNLMNDMPEKWRPGRQRNQPVRVLFTLPVRFQLLDT
jgi:protein TonB